MSIVLAFLNAINHDQMIRIIIIIFGGGWSLSSSYYYYYAVVVVVFLSLMSVVKVEVLDNRQLNMC